MRNFKTVISDANVIFGNVTLIKLWSHLDPGTTCAMYTQIHGAPYALRRHRPRVVSRVYIYTYSIMRNNSVYPFEK